MDFIYQIMTTSTKFYNNLTQKIPFEPTKSQYILLEMLSKFIVDSSEAIFLLRGYAGTGKTTMISAVVNNLSTVKKKAVLLAPTGRAAKVISAYANKKALTIHKGIYFPKKNKSGGIEFALKKNRYAETLFVVDEASMISGRSEGFRSFQQNSLLDDLVNYVYSGKNCKLILVGDTAQLPPVKLDKSSALDADYLRTQYLKEVVDFELDEVVRQQAESGILHNATQLRMTISEGYTFTNFKFTNQFKDTERLMDGYEIEDALISAYNKGLENTTFIVRSNKRANQYNQQIRSRILGLENEIATGDFIMVVKNNYYWLDYTSEAGFIANGDICEILQIYSTKLLYGFHFAEVKVRMVDYPNQNPFDTVVLLDTLHLETPSLSYEDSNKLYQEVLSDYVDQKSKYKQMLSVKNNRYFNALQIKFSYAVTCHKSQGGQWDTVFIEQPYLPDGQSIPYLRWLYTAITRAQQKVYLIGFGDTYF